MPESLYTLGSTCVVKNLYGGGNCLSDAHGGYHDAMTDVGLLHRACQAEADDTEVPLRPEEKRRIDFRGKLYLAPLTTVGNLPYRCAPQKLHLFCGAAL